MKIENKIFIFDFDGVILDTDLLKYKIFSNLFKNENKVIQKKILKYHFLNQGINRIKKFEYILNTIIKKQNTKYSINFLEKSFSKQLNNKIDKCKFSTGSIRSLKFLNEKNINVYVATGVKQKEIDKIVINLRIKKYFKKIYGYPLKKDKIISKIKTREKIKNHNIYFVGDSMSDLRAARKMKINFLGRKTTFNSTLLGRNRYFKEKNVYKIVKKVF